MRSKTELKLYEVAGEDNAFRPSPYCWRIRMALAHKGLQFTSIPWRAVEKDRIVKSGGGTVPVLVDDECWIRESWDIATYLEEKYPEGTSLFNSEGDRIKAAFLDAWVTITVHPIIFRIVVQEQFPLLAKKDQIYYQERTKAKFGKTIAELGSSPQEALTELQVYWFLCKKY